MRLNGGRTVTPCPPVVTQSVLITFRTSRRSACRHLTQDSSADSGTRTEILISEVEMSSAFTPCRARDSKSCVATPACERMPTPTIASLATRVVAELVRAPGNSVVMFRAIALGLEKIVAMNGKREILKAIPRCREHDHVDLDIRIRDRLQHAYATLSAHRASPAMVICASSRLNAMPETTGASTF